MPVCKTSRQDGLPDLQIRERRVTRSRVPMANHVFAHAGLADVNAELEQFAMDA